MQTWFYLSWQSTELCQIFIRQCVNEFLVDMGQKAVMDTPLSKDPSVCSLWLSWLAVKSVWMNTLLRIEPTFTWKTVYTVLVWFEWHVCLKWCETVCNRLGSIFSLLMGLSEVFWSQSYRTRPICTELQSVKCNTFVLNKGVDTLC